MKLLKYNIVSLSLDQKATSSLILFNPFLIKTNKCTETTSSLNMPCAAAVTKANVVQLKLFDQYLEGGKQQGLLNASALSRENSNLYREPRLSGEAAGGDMLGDLFTKDLLQIRQLNRNCFELL